MPTTSDAAVAKATGKKWDDWFALLDKAGGAKMTHKAIVAVLADGHDVGPWWRQMVTVEYERARGLRVRHQTAEGFNISASKTIVAPVTRLYTAWATPRARLTWLADAELTLRTATPKKTLRFTWSDGPSSVEVRFLATPSGKTQVTVDHNKLKTAAAAARMKTYWKKQLGALQRLAER